MNPTNTTNQSQRGGDRWLDQASRALADQAAALEAIDQLGPQMSAGVHGRDLGDMEAVLATRQTHIDRIDEAHTRLTGLLGPRMDRIAGLSPDEQRHLQQQLDRVATTAVEVMSRDAKLRQSLEMERDRILGELRESTATRQAGDTYARTSAGGAAPRYQDEEA